MKIRKYIMVLVLLPLFLSVGYADDNNASVKSLLSSPDPKDAWGFSEIKETFAEVDKLIAENEAAKAENKAEGTMEEIIAENKAAKAENKAARMAIAAH